MLLLPSRLGFLRFMTYAVLVKSWSFTWTIKTTSYLSSASRTDLDCRKFKNICWSVVQRGRYDAIREASYEHPVPLIIHLSVEVDGGGVGSEQH